MLIRALIQHSDLYSLHKRRTPVVCNGASPCAHAATGHVPKSAWPPQQRRSHAWTPSSRHLRTPSWECQRLSRLMTPQTNSTLASVHTERRTLNRTSWVSSRRCNSPATLHQLQLVEVHIINAAFQELFLCLPLSLCPQAILSSWLHEDATWHVRSHFCVPCTASRLQQQAGVAWQHMQTMPKHLVWQHQTDKQFLSDSCKSRL